MILKLLKPVNEVNAAIRFKLIESFCNEGYLMILSQTIESESDQFPLNGLITHNYWEVEVVEDEPDDKVSLSSVKWGFQLAMIMGAMTGFIVGCVCAYYFLKSI